MKHIFLLSLLGFTLLTGCATAPENASTESAVAANAATNAAMDAPLGTKYPVHERLEYMAKCIQQHDAKVEATEPCGCKINKISEKLTFKEYELALTFTNLSRQNGDAGSAFRDPDQSKDLRKRFKEADKAAEQSCFPK